jgi:UDPglucose 6-dehydrogenase
MRIAIIGTGYVGLVSGVCFSEFGHDVICVDNNVQVIERLQAGQIPIFEPGLEDLVARNAKAGRLRFTTNLVDAVAMAEAVFIAVGTPPSRRGDGHADLSYVYAAAEQIALAAPQGCLVITKSTVPVGTGAQVADIIARVAPEKNIKVASNPEFLREGSAIEDFMRPDRVICGVVDEEARRGLQAIYRPLSLRETPIQFTSRETAEVIKYAANAFLATKISFINEMADLCEEVGANIQDVARGIGLDKRIGDKFLHAGPGYGGSCFPKDTEALLKTAQSYDVPLKIVAATVAVNKQRKAAMAQRIIKACGGVLEGKTLAVLGLTFKPNTDDMREAPSLVILPALQAAGAQIKAFDPEGYPQAKSLLPGVQFAQDAYQAIDGADALIILTEWNEFRALDLERVKRLLKAPLFIDLRNIYKPAEMAAAGFHYLSIGRSRL